MHFSVKSDSPILHAERDSLSLNVSRVKDIILLLPFFCILTNICAQTSRHMKEEMLACVLDFDVTRRGRNVGRTNQIRILNSCNKSRKRGMEIVVGE